MIRIVNLKKRYDGEIVDTLKDVSLSLPDVGLVYLVGPSGSGKTTLATIIGCMDDEYDGRVSYDGIEYESMSSSERSSFRLRHVSFSFQGGFMDGSSTVNDELMKAMVGLDGTKEEKNDRIGRILRCFDLGGYERCKIATISGGERKRVSLAKALVRDCDMVIVDEPTAGLNPEIAERTMELLRKKSKDCLVLVITHDEIDATDCMVLRMNDGKVEIEDCLADKDRKVKTVEKKKRIGPSSLLMQSMKTYLRHFKRSLPSMIATTISLTCFGMSLSLIGGVRVGLMGMKDSTFDTHSVMVEPNSNKNIAGRNVLGDEVLASEVWNDFPDLVASSGVEYYVNLNDMVSSTSNLYLSINENYTYPSNLGVDILAHSLWRDSCSSVSIKGMDGVELEEDELFLGFPSGGIRYLFNSFPGLYEYLERDKVTLDGRIGVEGVSGYREIKLKVKGFYQSSSMSIMHTSPYFSSMLLEEKVGFDVSYNLSSLDVKPHTLKKGGIVYVRKETLASFYRKFESNPAYSGFALEKYPSSLRIDTGIKESYVKLGMREKKYSEVNSYDMKEIVNGDFYVQNYMFSSDVYTYLQGGMYSGFGLPVFLSDERSKLIELSDLNSTTDRNLGMFQISQAQIPKGVVGADINSSIAGAGIGFSNIEGHEVSYGNPPADDSQIVISSSLARKIYGNVEPIGSNLCMLMLADIVKSGDAYLNKFYDCDLVVSGMVESNEDCLYHDAFFPQALTFSITERSGVDLTIDYAILKFSSDADVQAQMARLRKLYKQYDFYCPFMEMAEEFERVLDKIGVGLGIFASISLMLSTFLMFLTSYLVIKEDERGIGDYLSLGYGPSDVRLIYVSYVMMVGLVSFLESSAMIWLGERLMGRELTQIFGSEMSMTGMTPYSITLLLCLGVSLVVSLMTTLKVSSIDPRRGFRL